MDWTAILNQVFEFCFIPLMFILTGTVIYVVHWKKNQVVKELDNETAKQYVEMLDKTITDCVLATNQTYVEALKKAGSFDLDAQKQAFKLTYDAVMSILTDDAQEYLNLIVKDLTAYVTNKIEAQVVINKTIC